MDTADRPETDRELEHLERALTWGGALLLGAALLPIASDAGGKVFLWDLIDRPSGAVAAAAQVLAGVVLLAVRRARRWTKASRGLVAAAAAAVAFGALAADADAGQALWFALPRAMQRGGLFLLAGGAAAAVASLLVRTDRAIDRSLRAGRAAALVAATCAAVLYLWPHPTGTLAGALAEAALATVQAEVPLRYRGGSLTVVFIAALPAASAALAVRGAFLRRRAPSLVAGTFLAVALVFPVLGLKAASAFGSDLLLALGLRSAAIVAGCLAPLVFGVAAAVAQTVDPYVVDGPSTGRLLRDEVLFSEARRARTAGVRPDLEHAEVARFHPALRRAVRDRHATLATECGGDAGPALDRLLLRLAGQPLEDVTALDGAALAAAVDAATSRPRAPTAVRWLATGRRLEIAACAVGVAMAAASVAGRRAPRAADWPLVDPPAWAVDLYRDGLPAIAIAAGGLADGDAKAARDELARTTSEVAAMVEAPELRSVVEDLGRLAAAPGRNRRALGRAGQRLNAAARAPGLPLYLDVNVVGATTGRRLRWIFYVKTYRIERLRVARAGRASFGALWLRRLDRTNVVEQRLGWKKADQPYAMVILDVVEGFWRDELAPAIAVGAGSRAGRDSPLRRVAGRLQGDLAAALAEAGLDGAEARLSELLAVGVAPEDDETGPPHDGWTRAAETEGRVLEVLARMVEAHELQHQVDAEVGLDTPTPLAERMRGFSDEGLKHAAAELSAYLAEIARSALPRLALAHLVGVSGRRSATAEAFAGAVAIETLSGDGSIDDVLAADAATIRERARRAYRELFGADVVGLEAVR